MAFILLKNRQPRFVSAEKGCEIWRVINGEIKGTPEQKAFVKQIEMIYLNRANAPKSYLDKHPNPHPTKPMRPLVGQVRMPYND